MQKPSVSLLLTLLLAGLPHTVGGVTINRFCASGLSAVAMAADRIRVGEWVMPGMPILQLGDLAIWVGVTAEHRGAAFEACRYIIDEAKARLPIWKKEHYDGGATAWINCATQGEHGGAGAQPPA